MVSLNVIAGIVGMISILTAFVLDEFFDWCDQNTMLYNVLNIFGSGLLAYYAWAIKGWPFLVLNLVWLGAAAVKLVELEKIS